jgi:hypothetical protein
MIRALVISIVALVASAATLSGTIGLLAGGSLLA